MVVERSRASYLIDILGMLKVEGSNPGFAVYFSRNRLQSLDKNNSQIFILAKLQFLGSDHASRNVIAKGDVSHSLSQWMADLLLSEG